ncbi:MAG: glutamate--tRNA ligase [Flavobacteriales bacterium]|nr:glutamate--tRNA ligase [Flavobacteriales bacterium]
MEDRKVRVRFAPSPTGPLHIGGVRTALYNYLFAKKMGGDFILRIEDTDQTRYVPSAEEYIQEALEWSGIKIDEGPKAGGSFGPYRQSERKESYRQYAEQLIGSGHAYYAFDTTEELTEMRERLTKAKVASPQYNAITRETMKNSLTLSEDEVEKRIAAGQPYVIRIKIPRKEEVRIHDVIRGWVVVHSSQMDDKVLFKSDGMPTYHLANVVDDFKMKITHVIRGEEWLPSAPLHVLLYRYLGWEEQMPQFAHLPLILKPDGNGKLSKRDGDRLGFPVFPLNWKDPKSGEQSYGYRERGYFPEAFVNMLSMLGWNPGTSQELFSMDELVAAFSLERVGKSGSKFDPDKAKWFNQQYLRTRNNAELADFFQKDLQKRGVEADNGYVQNVCSLIKEKTQFVGEFWSIGSYFFQTPTEYDEKVIRKRWNENAERYFPALAEELTTLKNWNAETIEATFRATAEKLQINPGHVMQLFRVLVSGQAGGPALFEMAELLGKEVVVLRLKTGVEKLK